MIINNGITMKEQRKLLSIPIRVFGHSMSTDNKKKLYVSSENRH